MENSPDSSQMTRARLMEPVPWRTPPGAMKIPEPIMEPTMIEHPYVEQLKIQYNGWPSLRILCNLQSTCIKPMVAFNSIFSSDPGTILSVVGTAAYELLLRPQPGLFKLPVISQKKTAEDILWQVFLWPRNHLRTFELWPSAFVPLNERKNLELGQAFYSFCLLLDTLWLTDWLTDSFWGLTNWLRKWLRKWLAFNLVYPLSFLREANAGQIMFAF